MIEIVTITGLIQAVACLFGVLVGFAGLVTTGLPRTQEWLERAWGGLCVAFLLTLFTQVLAVTVHSFGGLLR